MQKPSKLKQNDKIQIVSLSSGIGGEPLYKHRYELGKKRLEELGLTVSTSQNALKGIQFLDKYPEKRAEDLMEAFKDPSIKAIICMIGGDDTIRLLPYIDFEIIKNNPKIFLGYSDSTINHFMMYKAGLTSFYGPSILAEFAENKMMHEYTKKSIKKNLFEVNNVLQIKSSPSWTAEYLEWEIEKNNEIARKMTEEKRGYELLQGNGIVEGQLLGGCLELFGLLFNTCLWPSKEEWKNKILFLETSEDYPKPSDVKLILRALAIQGIFDEIKAVIVGKPKNEKYYEEYKEVYLKVIKEECQKNIPILYNLNFGHNAPFSIIPYGINARIDCENKSFTFLESGVK